MRLFIAALLASVVIAAPAGDDDETSPARSMVPVFRIDFPDPFILRHDGRFFAYATNATELRANVQMAESTNLTAWRSLKRPDGTLHDAMPQLPAWAQPGWTWAPEIGRIGERFVLYFTARERQSDLQCVGVATASDPRGPFVGDDSGPLVCQRDEGGTIDASAFVDRDGQRYLYFKSDGNNPRVLRPSRIFVQKLSTDGLTLVGEPRSLLRNDRHWEWRVVESPTMVRNGEGGYTLFFSANHFGWENDQRLSNYAMGYARCESAMGPCVKAPENPILRSYNTRRVGCLSGPGHQTVLQHGGRTFLVFHAWAATRTCQPAGRGRYMYIAPLAWRGDTPVIGNSLR